MMSPARASVPHLRIDSEFELIAGKFARLRRGEEMMTTIGAFEVTRTDDGVALVVCLRPPVNAVSICVYEDVGHLVDAIEANLQVRAVVLTAPDTDPSRPAWPHGQRCDPGVVPSQHLNPRCVARITRIYAAANISGSAKRVYSHGYQSTGFLGVLPKIR